MDTRERLKRIDDKKRARGCLSFGKLRGIYVDLGTEAVASWMTAGVLASIAGLIKLL